MRAESARILTSLPDNARGLRRLLLASVKKQYGYVPGIVQVLLPDVVVGLSAQVLYNRLHLRKASQMTRLQREMLATVVNGKIGGAP